MSHQVHCPRNGSVHERGTEAEMIDIIIADLSMPVAVEVALKILMMMKIPIRVKNHPFNV